eukprot:2489415-Rhodomonas_salina.2
MRLWKEYSYLTESTGASRGARLMLGGSGGGGLLLLAQHKIPGSSDAGLVCALVLLLVLVVVPIPQAQVGLLRRVDLVQIAWLDGGRREGAAERRGRRGSRRKQRAGQDDAHSEEKAVAHHRACVLGVERREFRAGLLWRPQPQTPIPTPRSPDLFVVQSIVA